MTLLSYLRTPLMASNLSSFPYSSNIPSKSILLVSIIYHQTILPFLPVSGAVLSALHGQTLSLIQTMLKVLDCDLQVLLHPLQVSAGVQLQTYLELSLDVPQLFLGLSGLAVGVTELDLHLIEISLHLLLDSQSIVPASDFSVETALHGVNDSLTVPLDLLYLLILLSELPVNFSLDLVELQLDSQDLGFLMLQCTLNK
uniref:Uncharacterized protein n=1 Tax=Scleropages formosus TaxID=113540 RepID=A0A8C9W1A9_SCLFO